MTIQSQQLPWSVQMNEKSRQLLENPEEYFRRADENNSKSINEEKISFKKLFSHLTQVFHS
ncbi:hypothetical protein [Bombiscardovia coagulans]|uniref:Uncharacterized protein n=1 Tax=Bombiscardovia coagulans TaxID=686666 RepID=A0A261ESS2_9BIFI|nr:hypothetical protein [Bombiscardovia coagulans]OZG49901.1 hypothetical protein BOCO_0418 [Bombiscardovia coagulans]